MNRKRMIRSGLICIAFGAGLISGLWADRVSSQARADQPSVKQFVQIRWPLAGSLAPNGDFYYQHNPDGLNQLYVRRAGQEAAVKLTDFPDGMMSYTLSPDGGHIVISAAVGGNEQSNLYLMDCATGRIRALYCHPDIVYESVVWRRDSQAFAFKANDISRSDFYVYVYDLKANNTKRLVAEKGDYSPEDFSSDGKKLLVMKTNSATHTQLFEVDVATGKSREITPAGESWAYGPIGYAADDQTVLMTSDYHGDMAQFMSLNSASGAIEKLFPQFDAFEADQGVMNKERTLLAVSLNEDGYSTMHLFSLPDKKTVASPKMAKGLVSNIRFCGDQMLYAMDNANTPGTIFQWTIGKTDETPKALTRPDTQGIDVSKFRLPELVRYKSFDGLEVPAFLYLPAEYRKGEKIPFIVEYHGGPEGQYRPTFNRLYQYFLSCGYGVLAPNVRGSSGYGKKYLEMDNYKKRMDSVHDGVAAAKWLVEQGYSTPKQIAAYGGSYGGFMVMATITDSPDCYGAACNVVGICNMQTFLERTKDYRRKLREVEYGPLSDPEFLKSISPIYKVDKITAPLLIAHGENDPRVPIYEARQLYDKMTGLHKTVEILTFPDEGHGFRKEKNRIVFAEKLSGFFDRYLKTSGDQVRRAPEREPARGTLP
ncbi:MAG TPA: S9 family peptidase [Phycisphaerae bacterium]|nr:S9 family peptidase [Phycisphaerae bacterium]